MPAFAWRGGVRVDETASVQTQRPGAGGEVPGHDAGLRREVLGSCLVLGLDRQLDAGLVLEGRGELDRCRLILISHRQKQQGGRLALRNQRCLPDDLARLAQGRRLAAGQELLRRQRVQRDRSLLGGEFDERLALGLAGLHPDADRPPLAGRDEVPSWLLVVNEAGYRRRAVAQRGRGDGDPPDAAAHGHREQDGLARRQGNCLSVGCRLQRLGLHALGQLLHLIDVGLLRDDRRREQRYDDCRRFPHFSTPPALRSTEYPPAPLPARLAGRCARRSSPPLRTRRP